MKFIVYTCVGDLVEEFESASESLAEQYISEKYPDIYETCAGCDDRALNWREIEEWESNVPAKVC